MVSTTFWALDQKELASVESRPENPSDHGIILAGKGIEKEGAITFHSADGFGDDFNVFIADVSMQVGEIVFAGLKNNHLARTDQEFEIKTDVSNVAANLNYSILFKDALEQLHGFPFPFFTRDTNTLYAL